MTKLIAAWQQPYARMVIRLRNELNFDEADAIEKLCHEVQRRDLMLQSLTPGGSEFIMAPERCASFALGVKLTLHRQLFHWLRSSKRYRDILTMLGYSE